MRVETGEVLILKQVLVWVNLEPTAQWEWEDQVTWDKETWDLEVWDLEDNPRADQWVKECQTKAIPWACLKVRDHQLETLIPM